MKKDIGESNNFPAPIKYSDAELEARWHELVCVIIPNLEDDEETLGLDWFIFQEKTSLIEIYNWFDSKYSEGAEALKNKYVYFDWTPNYISVEAATTNSSVVGLEVIKGGKYENIKFIHVPELERLQWVEGCYNLAYTGKIHNESELREYMLSKIEALTTMQLLTLFRGQDYDTVVGNDVLRKTL